MRNAQYGQHQPASSSTYFVFLLIHLYSKTKRKKGAQQCMCFDGIDKARTLGRSRHSSVSATKVSGQYHRSNKCMFSSWAN